MLANYFVSVIVATRDDADILEAFAEELVTTVRERWQNFEVVFVDDGSRDQTPDVMQRVLAKHECVRYLRLSRSFGVEVAMSAGLDSVIGDVVVALQPESDPPRAIPEFIDAARALNGIVFGVRTEPQDDSILYRLGRRVFTRVVRRLLEVDVPERATLYFAMTRQSMNAIIQIKDKSRALRIFGSYTGFSHRYLEYQPKCRRPRYRRKKLREGIERGIGLIVTNSAAPLRFVSLAGLGASALNFMYMIYVIGIALFKDRVQEGWVTTSLQHSVMSLIMFIVLSVLCEYVGRLLAESRDRPLYFVAEERTSSSTIRDVDRRNVVVEST